jgi:2-hydroxycyclohexanecarboxyl-CoA dehydrogenase
MKLLSGDSMNLNIENKSVIVTGGGSNIGRAIVLAFAAEGAKIAIADIDAVQAEKVAEEARKAGAASVLVQRTDITKLDDVTALVKRVESEHGVCDILINNVGWTVIGLFVEQTREQWQREIEINLWGMINCTRSVIDKMIERKSGVVVSIGSDAGRMGEHKEGVYAACKAGVAALTKTLAREYGKYNLRFNVVNPGTTMPDSDEDAGTESMWRNGQAPWRSEEMRAKVAKAYPLRRIAKPSEVASVVLFLASDGASFMTGQTISASGGYTMI